MTGFHGNRVHYRMVDELIKQCGVTAFVETGTHYGETTRHVAERHSSLPIFTCEINDEYFTESARRMQVFPNVKISQESSEKFLTRLVSENVMGDLPMFFLDAHWHDYWPLKDETTIVGTLPAFILMVDDFMVPGRPWFETSAGGGGTIGEHRTRPDARPCAMSLIGDNLPDDCLVGYPTYTKTEAFVNPNNPHHLVGHAIILHGISLPEKLNDPLYEWGDKR